MLPTLDVRSRRRWRAWLAQHHGSSQGVWLVFHKNHTGATSVPYEEAVREALCFGWIDSLVKRLDADRYVRKFTPRQPSSQWSDINRRRWAALKEAGQLTAAGLAAAPTDKRYAPKPAIPTLPAYIAEALRANRRAGASFRALAPSYRRQYVGWIHTARRSDTRARRLREAIALLAAGKRLGLR
jgi:uncharacterized protein YdeI (YjbR/CyaY-like superfamily)